MEITVPLVVIVGIVVFIAVRWLHLRLWQAAVTALFGFLLAATMLAPHIRAGLRTAMQWLTGH